MKSVSTMHTNSNTTSMHKKEHLGYRYGTYETLDRTGLSTSRTRLKRRQARYISSTIRECIELI